MSSRARPGAAGRSTRKTIAIIGTGLIGASVGLALRRGRGLTRSARSARDITIVGWDPSRRNAATAKRTGAIDTVRPTLDLAIEQADIIVLAAPLRALRELVPRAIGRARSGALIIDVGGLKQAIDTVARRALRERPRAVRFVAGHPMAGNEGAGPRSASPTLFEGRPFAVYAPPQFARGRAWRAAESFVRALGGLPVRIAPKDHDRVVAATSALPQLAALAVALAAERAVGRQSTWLAGPGFEGATRLAESPFVVWDAALFENRRNARRALRALEREIGAIAAALERGNAREMEKIFRAAAGARRRICATRSRSKAARSL